VSARHAATAAAHPVALTRHPDVPGWDAASMRDGGGAAEAVVRGPATVALPDATMLVPDGWTARMLPVGGWMVER